MGQWKHRKPERVRADALLERRNLAAQVCAEEALRGFANTWLREADLGDENDFNAVLRLFRAAPSRDLFLAAQNQLGHKKLIRPDSVTEVKLLRDAIDAVRGKPAAEVVERDTIARSIRMPRSDFERLERVPGGTMRLRVLALLDLWERHEAAAAGGAS